MKKERPILFSTMMVQALLDGRKIQTRRVMKPQPEIYMAEGKEMFSWNAKKVFSQGELSRINELFYLTAPFGMPGDIMYVREEHYQYGQWKKNGLTESGRQKWRFFPDAHFREVRYFDNPPAKVEKNNHRATGWYKRLARFMPKSAARIWLEVTDIRVERVQEITEADAKAEGVERWTEERMVSKPTHYNVYYNGSGDESLYCSQAYDSFTSLWQKINGPESWEANQFVRAVGFKVLSTTGKPENI